ncbi:MAG: radical SAM protein [Acidobacteriota bacterium]
MGPAEHPQPLLPLPGLRPRARGLAAWARGADLLRRGRQATWQQLPVRSTLNRCQSGRMPFEFTLNPYRGCELGCVYCYARTTHEFLGLADPGDFETRIFAKTGAPERLRQELVRLPLAGRRVAIGTVTDPYQPAERHLKVTRRLLEVLGQVRGLNLSLTTKSDLVLRDLDQLSLLSGRHRLHVNITVVTVDRELARQLEPKAPRPDLRLRALARLRQAGIEAGVFAMPVLPGLTDSRESLSALARAAAGAGATFLTASPLFVRDGIKPILYDFLRRKAPHLLPRYRRAFARGASLPGAYAHRLEKRLEPIRSRFGLRANVARR